MTRHIGTIYVIDDDASVRDALHRQLSPLGYEVHSFASLPEFSRHKRNDEAACLVVDIRMSGPHGLEHPERRAYLFSDCPPIVFTAAHADVSTGVRAIKGGAIDFLMKPTQQDDVLAAVARGIGRDRDFRLAEARKNEIRTRYAALTPRQRQMLEFVARGRLNKQIAHDLGLSVNTVKMYRSQAMRRLQVTSRADVMRILDDLIDPRTVSRPPGPAARVPRRNSAIAVGGGWAIEGPE